jgi:hypothetical protein
MAASAVQAWAKPGASPGASEDKPENSAHALLSNLAIQSSRPQPNSDIREPQLL